MQTVSFLGDGEVMEFVYQPLSASANYGRFKNPPAARRVSLLAFAALLVGGLSSPALAAAPPSLSVGPIAYPVSINGQSITSTINVSVGLSTTTTEANAYLQATVSEY